MATNTHVVTPIVVHIACVWMRDKVGWDHPILVLWDGTVPFSVWLRWDGIILVFCLVESEERWDGQIFDTVSCGPICHPNGPTYHSHNPNQI